MNSSKMRNWDRYKTKQVNIRKAQNNPVVSQLLEQHYIKLHTALVKSDDDEDTFNDTYIKMTYCYKSGQDFMKQFTYQFNLLKGSYYRYDKQANWFISYKDQLPDSPESEPEPVKQIEPKNLLKTILDYALSQKIHPSQIG